MKEIPGSGEADWRPVRGFETAYAVSSHGDLMRTADGHGGALASKSLNPHIDVNGYPLTVLSFGGKKRRAYVHRLIAEAFLPNPRGCTDVNHKNGIKSDNRLENLEWCTRSENQRHAHVMRVRGDGVPRSAVTAE